MTYKARTDSRGRLGQKGEDAAAAFLEAQGYRIIERNHRSRWGEIDLIVRKERELVFVEVKTRRGTAAGSPLEAITPDKARRLWRLAETWLAMHHEHDDCDPRIDVIGILAGEPPEMEHVVNAIEG